MLGSGKITLFAILATLCLSSTALSKPNHFEESTIQALYFNCKSLVTLEQMACLKYIGGAYEFMSQISRTIAQDRLGNGSASDATLLSICPQGTVTVAMTEQVFIKWAEQNPKEWQSPQALGVWKALTGAWPCSPETLPNN